MCVQGDARPGLANTCLPMDSTLEPEQLTQPEPQRLSLDALSTAQGVLFDLDGTLADTAPDLAAAVNTMRRTRGLDMVPYELLRHHASGGARGLIGAAFGVTPEQGEYAAMREEFLANYEADLCVESVLFPGVDALLDSLDARDVPWGIVTNKIERLTFPLVAQLGLAERAGCIVCGDTTPYPKPHPAPVLYACERLGVAPRAALFVGDDERDVVSGRAAGTFTVAAAYGYCGSVVPPEQWKADALVESLEALAHLLQALGGTRGTV